MSDNKKYYYLKLKDNFYNTEDIKILESMKNGYEYSSLYLKLCLLSLKGEGELLYKNRIPYKPEMLATITGHKMEVIEFAIPMFQEMEMLTVLDNGTIFIDDIQVLTGHGSTEGERKAAYRKRLDDIKGQCPGQFPPELSKDKLEIELSKEKKETTCTGSDELAQLLYDEIIRNSNPTRYKTNPPKLKTWSEDIYKLLNIDKIDYDLIERVIMFATADKDFWAQNILSGGKLRKHFNLLELKMNSSKHNNYIDEKATSEMVDRLMKKPKVF